MPRKNMKPKTTEKRLSAVPVPTPKPTKAEPATVTETVAGPAIADLRPLLVAIRNIDADIACEAATSLGNSGNPAAVEPLIDIVRNSNGYFHGVVRSAAAAGLATLNDRRAVDALLAAVNDPITDPSTEAIRALAKLGDARALPVLVQVVINETGFYAGSVRRAAVLGLIQLGGEIAQKTLRQVAANEQEDVVIREEAIAGLNAK